MNLKRISETKLLDFKAITQKFYKKMGVTSPEVRNEIHRIFQETCIKWGQRLVDINLFINFVMSDDFLDMGMNCLEEKIEDLPKKEVADVIALSFIKTAFAIVEESKNYDQFLSNVMRIYANPPEDSDETVAVIRYTHE